MKARFAKCLGVIGAVLCLGLGTACKKADGPGAETSTVALKLPGASGVIESVNKKEYAEALAALMKLKESLATTDQQMQFIELTREVRGKLTEASPADPQAAEALKALRVISGGR